DALLGVARELSGPLFVLDSQGEAMNSDDFAQLLLDTLRETTRASFVIGGAEGLPEPLRPGNESELGRVARHLSLSQMTFPHRLARVLLLEQIFRARELVADSGYHR
ncbi:rlmH, partial [Symbiodinium pilosum]